MASPRLRRRLFIGTSVVSYGGDWLTTYTLGIVLYLQTGNAAASAMYFALRTVPRLAGPLLGGAASDRLGSLRAAAWISGAQGALTGGVIAGIALGSPSITMGFALVAQFAGSAMRPTSSAALTAVADDPDRIQTLSGQLGALIAATAIAAPVVGVILIVPLGPGGVVVIDLTTFVLATGSYVWLASTDVAPRVTGPPLSIRAAVAGLGVVFRVPFLRLMWAAWTGSAVAVTCIQTILVAAAVDATGGASSSGLMFGAVGIGGLVGCVVMLARRVTASRPVVVLSFLAEVLPLAALSLAHSLVLLLVCVALSSLGSVGYQVLSVGAVAERVEANIIGRVNAAMFFGMAVGAVGGGGVGAGLVSVVGWRETAVIGTVVAVLTAAGAVCLPVGSRHPTGVRDRALGKTAGDVST